MQRLGDSPKEGCIAGRSCCFRALRALARGGVSEENFENLNDPLDEMHFDARPFVAWASISSVLLECGIVEEVTCNYETTSLNWYQMFSKQILLIKYTVIFYFHMKQILRYVTLKF